MVNLGPTSPVEIIHQTPSKGATTTPCCSRTPFELPTQDRMANDPDLVICKSPYDPCPLDEGHCERPEGQPLEDHLFTQHDEEELAALAVRQQREIQHLTAHLNAYITASYAPGVQKQEI